MFEQMQPTHKHFINGFMACIGAAFSWLGAHGEVINQIVSLFSLYGGALVVAISLVNAIREFRKNRK